MIDDGLKTLWLDEGIRWLPDEEMDRFRSFPEEVKGVELRRLPEGVWRPDLLRDRTVHIEGEDYRVKAVERFSVMCSPEHPYWLSCILFVRPA